MDYLNYNTKEAQILADAERISAILAARGPDHMFSVLAVAAGVATVASGADVELVINNFGEAIRIANEACKAADEN